MEKPNRICFILPTLHAGGMENYCLRFARHMNRRFDLSIICLHPERGDLHEAFEAAGVRLIYKQVGYFNPAGFLRLYRFLKKERFQTMVDFTGNFSGFRLLLMRMAGVPRRLVFYRRSSNAFKKSLLKTVCNAILNNLVYWHATQILSNSSYALEYFFNGKSVSAPRFKVIPNGIDTQDFTRRRDREATRKTLGIPKDALVIGHVGRLDPAKNHATIFKLAQQMQGQPRPPCFVFCGRGTQGPAFQNQVAQFGITKMVLGLGLQADIPAVLQAMDVFYFPSLTEGQPNALIEAMLSGVPVVASNIPGIKEVMPARQHALLLDPVDVQGALQAVSDIDLGRHAQALRRWAIARFDQKKNFKLFEDVL